MNPTNPTTNPANGQPDNTDGGEALFAPRYSSQNQSSPQQQFQQPLPQQPPANASAFPWQPEQAVSPQQHMGPGPDTAPNEAQPAPQGAWQNPQPQYSAPSMDGTPQSDQFQGAARQPSQSSSPQWQPSSGSSTPLTSPRGPMTTGSPRASQQAPGMGPQFGGPMAELPPLAPAQPPVSQPRGRKPRRNKLMLGLIVGAGLIFATLVVLIAVSLMSSGKKDASQEIPPVTYNSQQIDTLVRNKQVDEQHVQQLNKTSAFYTVFKRAAMQPVAQTKWNVYYTNNEQDKRGDQHTMYDVSVDYRTKQYAYMEDSYSTIGVLQSRCIEGQQYGFNASKLSSGGGWQASSDSTTCKFDVVATRMNDGMNTGGLDDKQADAFVQKLHQSQAVTVNGVNAFVYKDVPYLKFDVTITPREAAKGIYWGMQNFMTAFQATGLNPEKHPYTYFGTGNEGMHLVYYVDPVSQLPVHAQITSTPAFNESGRPISPKSWSHRSIEYAFPAAVAKPTLDDHNQIGFTNWPDH